MGGGRRGGTCLGANIIVECLAGKLSGRGEPRCTQNRPQLRSPDEIRPGTGASGGEKVASTGRVSSFGGHRQIARFILNLHEATSRFTPVSSRDETDEKAIRRN